MRSGFVSLTPPGRLFAPIEREEAQNTAIADLTNDFHTVCVPDFPVDGTFSHAAWRRARRIAPLMKRGQTPREMSLKSDIRLLYSNKALYIGGVCFQPMDRMYAKIDQHDLAVWGDDNVEIFLHIPREGNPGFYHYVLNPLGAVYEDCDNRVSYWTVGAEVKVTRSADRWTFEMRLPFEGIPVERPLADDRWGVRICRTVHDPSETGTFPYLPEGGHCQRRYLARLVFGAPEGASAEALAKEAEAFRREARCRRFYREFAAARRRVRTLQGIAPGLPLTHPFFREAAEGVAQMAETLDAFERKFAADLATRRLIPQKEAAAFLAEYAGFAEFADAHAYFIWEADPWADGSPDDLPTAETPAVREIVFRQAVNEREGVTLNARAVLAGTRADLRFVPKTMNSNGLSLPKYVFEVRTEPFIRYENKVISAPLVKTDGDIVTLTSGETTRIRLTLNSRNVKPGDYATVLTVKSAYDTAITDRTLAIRAKIWRFALPEPCDWPLQSFFWGPHEKNNDEVQVLKLMHDYHVSQGWTKGHLYQYGLSERDWYAPPRAKFAHDFDPELAATTNEEFFRTAKALKMRFVFGWGTPMHPEWFRLMSDRLTKMGFQPRDFIFKSLIADEFAKSDIPKCAAERLAVSAVSTNWWFQNVYLSIPPPQGATMDDIERAGLSEFYRQWTVIHGMLKDPERGPEVIRRLRAKGCEVWSYKCNTYMQSQDILSYYRLYLWDCYMMGLDGAALWCSGSPSVYQDGFDSRDGYDDGALWAVEKAQCIPTKRFESFREGLEDVAYMARLEKIVAEREKRHEPVPPEARDLLDAREGILQRARFAEVLDWRDRIGELLDRLGE